MGKYLNLKSGVKAVVRLDPSLNTHSTFCLKRLNFVLFFNTSVLPCYQITSDLSVKYYIWEGEGKEIYARTVLNPGKRTMDFGGSYNRTTFIPLVERDHPCGRSEVFHTTNARKYSKYGSPQVSYPWLATVRKQLFPVYRMYIFAWRSIVEILKSYTRKYRRVSRRTRIRTIAGSTLLRSRTICCRY